MGGQNTNRGSRGNISGIWNHIRGVAVSFVWYETIINFNGGVIQIWDTNINWKVIIGAFIKFPAILFSH